MPHPTVEDLRCRPVDVNWRFEEEEVVCSEAPENHNNKVMLVRIQKECHTALALQKLEFQVGAWVEEAKPSAQASWSEWWGESTGDRFFSRWLRVRDICWRILWRCAEQQILSSYLVHYVSWVSLWLWVVSSTKEAATPKHRPLQERSKWRPLCKGFQLCLIVSLSLYIPLSLSLFIFLSFLDLMCLLLSLSRCLPLSLYLLHLFLCSICSLCSVCFINCIASLSICNI